MRKLGIIGGTSWNSTELYYRAINEGIARRLGGLHSARLMIESIDLAPYAAAQRAGQRARAEAHIVKAGEALKAGGADAILIASNTSNRFAPAVAEATGLEMLGIAPPTIARLKADERQRVALLGTRFTMTHDEARTPYLEAGLDLMDLQTDWLDEIDRIIFEELAVGVVKRDSQRALKSIITELDKQKADAVILGCTELVLAVDARANVLPVYDTTAIHAASAVDWLVGGEAATEAA
ncbi:aspartate/glutamate racemase family protein [Sphingomicrobium sediminis]|uniref:Amino acid racemase n=1 Tax=Sphingomicrobium sediminis TaxID=2950949 RepID=A0A9X2J2S5_9SPHN|nr:amino acid racemase [Sphingomicrobium sediminis]MCM8556601.1 amino acid racemase [Sphingomicrobium sediminis]